MLEKCTVIMPAMEFVLKQFTAYCEEGVVEEKYVGFQSDALLYRTIPSLQDKKYVYTAKGNSERIQNILFSKKNVYAPNDERYDMLYDYLKNEEVQYKELDGFQKKGVDWLFDKEILKKTADGNIAVCNQQVLATLKILYENDVIVYAHFKPDKKESFDKMEKAGLVEIESSLFSRQEADYLDYYLNRRTFDNGLDLRNRYNHQQPKSGNAERREQDYMKFLILFIITVIKINDDVCYRDSEDES